MICYSDRSGMRYSRVDFGAPSRELFPPVTKWLLIVNIGLWALVSMLLLAGVQPRITELSLTPRLAVRGHLWQLATYMFLHAPLTLRHILPNMLATWGFGAIVERSWGSRTYLRYYLTCGVGAAVFVIIVYHILGLTNYTIIGASGAIYGLMVACAVLFGEQQILFNFVVPVKLKWAVLAWAVMDFLMADSSVSLTAHWGGALTGFLYFKSGLLRPSARRSRTTSFWANLQGQYKAWRLQRAKRKFEVYMRKQDQGRGPWVH